MAAALAGADTAVPVEASWGPVEAGWCWGPLRPGVAVAGAGAAAGGGAEHHAVAVGSGACPPAATAAAGAASVPLVIGCTVPGREPAPLRLGCCAAWGIMGQCGIVGIVGIVGIMPPADGIAPRSIVGIE